MFISHSRRKVFIFIIFFGSPKSEINFISYPNIFYICKSYEVTLLRKFMCYLLLLETRDIDHMPWFEWKIFCFLCAFYFEKINFFINFWSFLVKFEFERKKFWDNLIFPRWLNISEEINLTIQKIVCFYLRGCGFWLIFTTEMIEFIKNVSSRKSNTFLL